MELKNRIIRNLEWSNKRLKLIGKGLDEEQMEIIEFSLLHDLMQLSIPHVSDCKTEPKLNRLETELDKLQKVHGEITLHIEFHSGCDSFKFKDGAVYRVKIERQQTKATLD